MATVITERQTSDRTAPESPAFTSLRAFWHGDERLPTLERYAALAARILLSSIFLISGATKVMDWSGNEAKMAQQGMFAVPFFLAAATVAELGLGLALLLGFKARLSALLLVLYLIPVTLVFHHFWSYPPAMREVQMLFFLHNFALIGGLLMVVAMGPGLLSVDYRARRAP